MFSFRKITKEELPKVFTWLALPHVAAWWRESKDYSLFLAKYENALNDPTVGKFFICHNEKLLGLIAWYNAKDCTQKTFPEDTYGIDLFIAELEYLGKRYGQQIIKHFIHTILLPMKPQKLIADPEISNTRSIHVFEKIGFRKTDIIETHDGTQMVMGQLLEMNI